MFVCMRSASGGMVAGGSPWEVCVNGGSTGVKTKKKIFVGVFFVCVFDVLGYSSMVSKKLCYV